MRIDPIWQKMDYQRMENAVRAAEQIVGAKKNRPGARIFFTLAPNDGIYVPSKVIALMDEINKHPQLRPEMTFADLGSGLGRVCFYASCRFAQVVGFEKDPDLFEASNIIKRRLSCENVSFRFENFIEADLFGMDILYIYHPFFKDFTNEMLRMVPHIQSGTYVLANITHEVRKNIFERNGTFEPIYPEGVSERTAWYQRFHLYQKI